MSPSQERGTLRVGGEDAEDREQVRGAIEIDLEWSDGPPVDGDRQSLGGVPQLGSAAGILQDLQDPTVSLGIGRG